MDILSDPENFVDHIGRTTGSIASSMTYGFRLPDGKTALAKELLNNSHGFFQLVVASQLLEWYKSLRPLVRILPEVLNPFAKKARTAYKREAGVFKKCFRIANTPSTTKIDLPSMRNPRENSAGYLS